MKLSEELSGIINRIREACDNLDDAKEWRGDSGRYAERLSVDLIGSASKGER